MNEAPVGPSRRSRREARVVGDVVPGTEDTPSSEISTASEDPSQSKGADGVSSAARARRDRDASPRVHSGFAGTWKPLASAAGALVVAIAVGSLASVAFDGDTGRSIGGLAAALILGATGLALAARTRVSGFFSLRALDVLWGLVLGVILPFLTGVFAGDLGFPALAALSPRWLVLGVAAPFVVVLGLMFFAIFFVYPAAESFAATRLSPVWSRVVAAAASTLAFAVVPAVFSPTVSGMPRALLIGLGLAASVFVALSRRSWGPLLTGLVFTAVWVALAAAGYVLA